MRKFISLMIFLFFIITLQSLPVFFLKNIKMGVIENQNIILHYDIDDKAGAEEVFNTINSSFDRLRDKLECYTEGQIEVYCYSTQKDFQIRKLGYCTLLFNIDWYIGDNKGDKALIVSPNIQTSPHSKESLLGAANHEIVHAMNYLKNPNLSYFLDNGIAEYLSHPSPRKDFFKSLDFIAPDMDYFCIKNQLKFGNTGGYTFSYTFIEFVDKNYGWDSVLELSANEDYEKIFHKSFEKIYNEWIDFLIENYS